jgi:hypothetical protein
VVADVQNEFESPVVVVRKAGQGWNVGGNGPKPLSGRLGVDIGSTLRDSVSLEDWECD